ncbi:amino acid adenylation domain-containing protein [Pseudonocardia sp. NPDC046786]|uniref:non-ribosomal peptide synthetase n=1 Tax=Pseudonocardia sp. NPDC046786 TaxID=3155471 RepID=UPI0033C9A164
MHEVPLTGTAVACPPDGAVLLAVHAVVLAALTGDPDVLVGYRPEPDGPVLPCPVAAGAPTWRELLAGARVAESELLAHRETAADGVLAELGLPAMPFGTVLDPAGDGGDPPPGAVLAVALVRSGGRPLLRLRYRTDAVDGGFAARIAGYHLTALDRIATAPDADPRRPGLLSAGELRFQLDGLAGPDRELPDRRFHELFEDRVAAHPDAVAIELGDRRRTYRELDERANRLAHGLLRAGLRAEDVVAVVTGRNLDWAAAVLAVFKAGGAYLPVEPHFPAERIATTLSRADCRFVLTEPGSTANLDRAAAARPSMQVRSMDDPALDDLPATAPGVAVRADQLAYIYFTSGSTGTPKGAMCEHGGMLNHLLAKIEDLGVGEGQAVAQTAPQCFDISLWQLVAALLVGGRTVLVEQELILDVDRYLDRIERAGVHVLQVVPSYLEVLLSSLDAHPRELPDLHTVSTTGEALKSEQAHRWFAARPGIRLANAYGLTETSDDVTHEILERVPANGRIPLGRPIRNTTVLVVDADLEPVPLGAPGEIVCAGICVGRGYVNDPDRTRAVFVDDPHRPGRRLYRSGDHGRWLPTGRLEFLGRRDAQVKVRGFRIEIGEIENALTRVPGVRDAAVVVDGRGTGLVAFYSATGPVTADALRERLAVTLPEYMVPSVFHRLDALPLTPNSKIDTKALAALVAEPDPDDGVEPPATPTERRVAAVWATVLGVERIGRGDDFFALGGSSLSAVKVVLGLDRVVSLTELTEHPELAALAALVDRRTGTAGSAGSPGTAGSAGSPGTAGDHPRTPATDLLSTP